MVSVKRRGARAKRSSQSRRPFTVVVGTDGSSAGLAAVDAVVAFPWPDGARVKAVVARGGDAAAQLTGMLSIALDAAVRRAADDAAGRLRKRWSESEIDVAISEGAPVPALLRVSRGADVTVVGSRGDSPLGPRVLGSVARGLIRGTKGAVLVVKEKRRAMHHLVVGFDGSVHARSAVGFVARLSPPPRGRVTLVQVVEPVRLASSGLLPETARKLLLGEARALEVERLDTARRDLEVQKKTLTAAGWSVRSVLRLGTPLRDLLAVATRPRADLLVVGARGVGGLERLLLGSVASATLDHAPMSVLVVR